MPAADNDQAKERIILHSYMNRSTAQSHLKKVFNANKGLLHAIVILCSEQSKYNQNNTCQLAGNLTSKEAKTYLRRPSLARPIDPVPLDLPCSG